MALGFLSPRIGASAVAGHAHCRDSRGKFGKSAAIVAAYLAAVAAIDKFMGNGPTEIRLTAWMRNMLGCVRRAPRSRTTPRVVRTIGAESTHGTEIRAEELPAASRSELAHSRD